MIPVAFPVVSSCSSFKFVDVSTLVVVLGLDSGFGVGFLKKLAIEPCFDAIPPVQLG